MLDDRGTLATCLDNFNGKMYPETCCTTENFIKSQKRVGVMKRKKIRKGAVHTTVEAVRMVKQNIREDIDKKGAGDKCRKARNIK